MSTLDYVLRFSHCCRLLAMGAPDQTWHSATERDIFHTNRKVTRKGYYMDAWGEFSRRSQLSHLVLTSTPIRSSVSEYYLPLGIFFF